MKNATMICKQAEAQYRHHSFFWDARRNGEAAAIFANAPYAEVDLDVYVVARRAFRSASLVLSQTMTREERWQWTSQEPRGAKAVRVAHAYGETTALLIARTIELAGWERAIGANQDQAEATERMAIWAARKAFNAAGVVLAAQEAQ